MHSRRPENYRGNKELLVPEERGPVYPFTAAIPAASWAQCR